MGLLSVLDDVGISKADIDMAIGASAEIRAGVMAKAVEVRDHWASISPVFGDKPPHRAEPPHGDPGQYRDSIRISYAQKSTGFFSAKVFTTNYLAHWIEYGSSKMPEYAPAQKTADHFNGGNYRVSA